MLDLIISKGIIKYVEIPKIFPDNKPVIFWDTCSLLYFNSIVDRRAYKEYVWDFKLLELIELGEVYSVTSYIVHREFNKHHTKLKNKDQEKESALRSAMKQYGKILGGQYEIDLDKGFEALRLSSHMDNLVCRLWSNTYVIEEDSSFLSKAHNRVLAEISPSSEKQQYKDCYIWETFLTLCDYLPNKGTAYFMTENIVDYCGKSKKDPLPDILEDLTIHQSNLEITKCQLWVDIAKKIGKI